MRHNGPPGPLLPVLFGAGRERLSLLEKRTEVAGGLQVGILEKRAEVAGGLQVGIFGKRTEVAGGLQVGIFGKRTEVAGGLQMGCYGWTTASFLYSLPQPTRSGCYGGVDGTRSWRQFV